jgi:SnoaL-like protein
VEPSEEIRRVVIRFFDALRDGDEEAVSNRISRQPGFERFGTDAVEWWQDGDAAARVWIQVMREIDGYPWRLVGDVHAMSEGSVGWAGARAEFDAAEGPVELRFTCVLHLEHRSFPGRSRPSTDVSFAAHAAATSVASVEREVTGVAAW